MGILAELYEQDFHQWAMNNAELIRTGRFSEIDFEHIAEELESMGASARKELASRLEVLLMHLLKWQFQPSRRGRSWEITVREQRSKIADHLVDNPSLTNETLLASALARAYKYALLRAALETGLSEDSFPKTCPYSWEQLMDSSFYPDRP